MKKWWKTVGTICLIGALTLTGCTGQAGNKGQETQNSTADITTEESSTLENGFIGVNETVIVSSNATLRKEASVDSEVVAEVEKGTALNRIGYSDVWSMIEYKGEVCYVSTQYVTVSEHTESTDDSTSQDNSVQESESQETEPVTDISSSTEPSSAQPAVSETNPAFTGDISALDNTPQGWGYGPDRDEKNRPTTALNYQKKYGVYADFIKEDTNTIYLTMDEGYEYGFTPSILDTLKEKNVKAVFFLTKQFVEGNPDLVQRMVDEGHVIGNHSSKHPADGMPSYTIDGQVEDIMWMHNYIKENYGYEMKLFRYPAGIFSEQSLALLDSLGYRAVFWSFAHKDWIVDDQPDPSVTLQRCIDALHPGAIYLLHAVSQSNTEALGDFIDQARALGYEFGVYQ